MGCKSSNPFGKAHRLHDSKAAIIRYHLREILGQSMRPTMHLPRLKRPDSSINSRRLPFFESGMAGTSGTVNRHIARIKVVHAT